VARPATANEQVGRGRSGRLADPRGYTMERNVADLGSTRRQIGAERMVLIGHPRGGLLAAAYPGRVSTLVLSSPEDAVPAAGGTRMLGRLNTEQPFRVYAVLHQPRALIARIIHAGGDWSATGPRAAPLQDALQAWETAYNHDRPHQALGYLTPAEHLATLRTPQV
jgi:pimeloyl-ACP methyl ester carboxylesterase